MRRRVVLVCALAAILGSSSLVAAHAATTPAAAPTDDGVSVGTSIAPPEQIANARPIKGLQGPLSSREPNQCEGLTGPKTESLGGVREGGGAAVSPGDIDLERLEPNTDYAACISVINFEAKGAPLTGRLDDVDIVASATPFGGIDVIDRSTGVGTWIMPSVREFSVPPMSRTIIPYVVHTPDRIPAGTVVGGVAARFTANTPIASVITQRVYVSGAGGQHRPLKLSSINSSRLLGREGHKTFNAKFDVKNPSDYVEAFDIGVEMKGLGRTVRKSKATNGALLPGGKMRVGVKVEDMPWIGVYRPKLLVKTEQGTEKVKLPLVWVLPPWYFVVAIILAILFPIVVLVRRWWENRQDWMQYLDEDEDYDEEFDDLDMHAY